MNMVPWYHNYSWVFLSAHKPRSWEHMSSHKSSWVLMVLWHHAQEYSWLILAAHGCLCMIMSACECSQLLISKHDSSWAGITIHEDSWAIGKAWHHGERRNHEHSLALRSCYEHGAVNTHEPQSTIEPYFLMVLRILEYSGAPLSAHECLWLLKFLIQQ